MELHQRPSNVDEWLSLLPSGDKSFSSSGRSVSRVATVPVIPRQRRANQPPPTIAPASGPNQSSGGFLWLFVGLAVFTAAVVGFMTVLSKTQDSTPSPSAQPSTESSPVQQSPSSKPIQKPSPIKEQNQLPSRLHLSHPHPLHRLHRVNLSRLFPVMPCHPRLLPHHLLNLNQQRCLQQNQRLRNHPKHELPPSPR